MIRHNLRLIFRSFKHFKSIFLINLIGLSSGLACALFIYLWVVDELKIDQFHEKSDRLYYVWEHRKKADGIWTSMNTSGLFGEAIVMDMPEVETACTTSRPDLTTLSVGEKTIKMKGRYAGKDFFSIFSYPIIEGVANKVLLDKKSIVISESMAIIFFESAKNAVGKMIDIEHNDQLMVSGVYRDIPPSSSNQFDFVGSFEYFKQNHGYANSWGSTGFATYVLLKPGVDINAFNTKLADYVNIKSESEVKFRTTFLKKYSEIYLYGKYENGVLTGGRITYVKLFSLIAIFILVIACINFMNLSTAKATRRIKEVGIRKAVGAGRRSLIGLYMSESLLMSSLSMLVALLMVDVLLPAFNTITDKQLSLSSDLSLMLVLIVLATGLLAGSYPALYLSGFRPAVVLKGKLNTSLGEIFARKGLVIFQFSLSVILIVAVLIVYRQIEFVQSKDLGYDSDNMLRFYREGKLASDDLTSRTVVEEIKKLPGVVNASTIGHSLNGHDGGTSGLYWEGKDPDDRTEFEHIAVDYGMMETMGVKMVEGRMFSENFPGDTAKIIINETGLKFMGLKEPIGANLKLWGKDVQIIGIAKDIHYESLHENLKPLFFRFNPGDTYIVMAKIKAADQDKTIKSIERLYQQMNPGFAFEYSFLDEDHRNLYVAEQRVSILSRYFAGLAILISCLGLFGLASFTAERRLKEIGIRKVLGSTNFGIVYLLSADFTKIVFVAIIIALPFSYWLTTSWLESFAFRVPLSAWYFAGSGLAALMIAWLTVSIQAVRAARVNPTKCLKDE